MPKLKHQTSATRSDTRVLESPAAERRYRDISFERHIDIIIIIVLLLLLSTIIIYYFTIIIERI